MDLTATARGPQYRARFGEARTPGPANLTLAQTVANLRCTLRLFILRQQVSSRRMAGVIDELVMISVAFTPACPRLNHHPAEAAF